MSLRSSHHLARATGPCLVALLVPSLALAAPQITALSLHGLQTGATTTLTVDGADLLPEPRLILSVPVASQIVRPGATATRLQLDVTLGPEVPPGIYLLRLATPHGISNGVAVGIDALPQQPVAPQITALPVALHGSLAGSSIVQTSFAGKKGQHVVLEIEARRLGAAIDPLIELLDPRGIQIGLSRQPVPLSGDARLELQLPRDGTYTAVVHDTIYRAGAPGFFRLKVGDIHYADLAYPLGGRRGSTVTVGLIGNLPGGTPGVPADLTAALADVSASWAKHPAKGTLTGPAPRVTVSDFLEVLETPVSGGTPQEVTVPAVINGRLSTPREEDTYKLRVSPGMALRFDVQASRLGSPLDGVLTLTNEAGAVLANSDDRPNTTDPGFDFTVPAGMSAVRVKLTDLHGRGGPDFVYRIVVKPVNHPDFNLTVAEERQHVPQNGAAVLVVKAARAGYNGPIKLTIPGLPAGVTLSDDEIPTGVSEVLLSFAAAPEAKLSQGVVHIIGTAVDLPELRRTAMLPESPLTARQPWLGAEFAFAVIGTLPGAIAWESTEPTLPVGSAYEARVKLTRGPALSGPVRLVLLTSQIVPPAPPNNKDPKLDPVNRSLRFEGTPMVSAGQSAGTGRIVVPADLPAIPYDLAIRAEFLSADGKTVLASAVTPSRRLRPSQPFRLKLNGEAVVEAKAGAGPTGKLIGTVVRAPGFTKPVTVTLAGLPPQLPPPAVLVPSNQSEFELPIAFPYGTKPGPVQSVQLVATIEVEQKVVRSASIPLKLTVVPGEPPPPPPALLRLFEDEPTFPALFNSDAKSQARLDTIDRYSGSAALSVTGVERSRQQVPGWSYRITEKPGNGEYRYLRFAWKRRGRGNNLLLQLGANGSFGPQRGSPGPSFRYEVGADNAFNLAAVLVGRPLPRDWTVVTRDLFADFGAFTLTGLGLTVGTGEGWLDHVYLARTLDDFKGCPPPLPAEPPLAVFEDQPEFIAKLTEGGGTATLETAEKYSGTASVKVTPDQRYNPMLPGLGVRIRENPGAGEYRYLRFAWKKKGGTAICFQLNHDGQWGPQPDKPAKFRYHAGPGPECYGASLQLDAKLPASFVLVTRDLFADFGEFTLTGIALSPVDGEYALFDHIYLGKTPRDFEKARPKKPAGAN